MSTKNISDEPDLVPTLSLPLPTTSGDQNAPQPKVGGDYNIPQHQKATFHIAKMLMEAFCTPRLHG